MRLRPKRRKIEELEGFMDCRVKIIVNNLVVVDGTVRDLADAAAYTKEGQLVMKFSTESMQ